MKYLLFVVLFLSLIGVGHADDTNCRAYGTGGFAVTSCSPATSYGCRSENAPLQILAADGHRTSILFQDTGNVPIILGFGNLVSGTSGFVIQPGMPFLWSNLNQGNIPGHVTTTPMSIVSTAPSSCVFLFTD